MSEFELAITKTLQREGGSKITNIANDNGGLTKYGISQKSYPAKDIKNLTEQQAKDIYYVDYWIASGANNILSQELAEAVFDYAVNAGPNTAKKLYELSIPEATAEENILARFALLKIMRYIHLCQKDATQKRFLMGWILRTIGSAA